MALAAIGGGVGGSGFGTEMAGRLLPAGAPSWLQAGASAAANNALEQGIGMAVGLQDKFDWAGVAASGVGGAAGSWAGSKLKGAPVYGADGKLLKGSSLGYKLGTSGASLLANAATRTLIEGSDFGDNVIAALPSAIGGVIGQSIGERAGIAVSEAARVRAETAQTVAPLIITPANLNLDVNYTGAGLDIVKAELPNNSAQHNEFSNKPEWLGKTETEWNRFLGSGFSFASGPDNVTEYDLINIGRTRRPGRVDQTKVAPDWRKAEERQADFLEAEGKKIFNPKGFGNSVFASREGDLYIRGRNYDIVAQKRDGTGPIELHEVKFNRDDSGQRRLIAKALRRIGSRITAPLNVANQLRKDASLAKELHFDVRLDSDITLSGGGTRGMRNKVNLSEARGEVVIIWSFWSPTKPVSSFNISEIKTMKDPVLFRQKVNPLIKLLEAN